MNLLSIFIGILVLVIVQGIGLYFIFRKRNSPTEEGSGMVLLQQRIEKLAEVVDSKLGEGNRQVVDSLRTQFAQSQQLVKNIEDRVSSQLLEVAKGMAKNEESTN